MNNLQPTPFQTTMIEERTDPSGAKKSIASDGLLSFLNNLRDSAVDDDSRLDALETLVENNVGDGTIGPGFRNTVVDGGFEVWDGSRNLTLPALTGYTGCTMWSFQSTGFGGYTVSRQAGLVQGSQYSLRWQRTAGGAGNVIQFLVYDMETVNSIPLQGKTITLSFTARCGANYSAASGYLHSLIVTGTGVDQARRLANYTGEVQSDASNVLTTTTTRYTHSTTVAANATQVGFGFYWFPVGVAGAADYYEIDNVQLEVSSYATNFEVLPWDVIRQRVSRYFWKSFAYDTAPANAVGVVNAVTFWQCVAAGVATAVTITLPVQMRIVPTLVTFNVAAANIQIRNTTTGVDWTGTATVAAAQNMALAGFAAAGSAVGNINAVHVTADARI